MCPGRRAVGVGEGERWGSERDGGGREVGERGMCDPGDDVRLIDFRDIRIVDSMRGTI